jgi:hypothetical protein
MVEMPAIVASVFHPHLDEVANVGNLENHVASSIPAVPPR